MVTSRPAEALLEEYGQNIELEFVRGPSGKVHIIMPEKPGWARTEDEERVFENWGEAVEYVTAGSMLVCGLNRFVNRADGGKWDPIDTFPDGLLCASCVKGLGSQSPRAFEHPQTEEEES